MRVVLDTNVLVSAALAWHDERFSAARWIVRIALIEQRRYENVTSDPLMHELRSVLQRHPRVDASFADEFVEAVSAASTFTNIFRVPMGVRDPHDDKVVETAMNANVNAIVSGDHDRHDERAQRAIARPGSAFATVPSSCGDPGA